MRYLFLSWHVTVVLSDALPHEIPERIAATNIFTFDGFVEFCELCFLYLEDYLLYIRVRYGFVRSCF